MGKTKLTGILMHLEPEKAEALNALAKRLGIKRSVLMRSAIDDFLNKHRAQPKKAATKVVQFKTRSMLAADQYFDQIAKSLGKESFADIEADVAFVKALKQQEKKKKRTPRSKSSGVRRY